MAHMPFNPDNERHYVGFNLPANQLSSLDAERIKLRQGRSEFLRQALSSYIFACRNDETGTLMD